MKVGPDTLMPILRVRAGDVPQRLLVVGDPARAERVAGMLADSREISRNREYVLFAGSHAGETIGVASHGVGSAGAAVCFEELCRAGAQRIIRAGTCGGMQSHVLDGDLVIAHGAVRDDGVTPKLVPLGFPALASADIVGSLRAAAARRTLQPVEGVVLTSDLFYPHEALGSDLPMWQRTGVVAVEMECAALFITAALHGVSTGAILAVDGNPLAARDDDMAGYNPHRPVVDAAVASMIEVGLDAVAAPL
ncbi:MAG: nucleoside phosphorylase [Ilumatobacteraceae bacterium]